MHKVMSVSDYKDRFNKMEKVQKKIKNTNYDYECPNCNTPGIFIEYIDGSSMCISCKCDTEKKKRISTPKMQKINYYWSISEVPDNLKNASFERFEKDLNERVLNMWQGSKWYVNNLNKEKPESLVIVGSIGVGKTHMAIAIARELKQKGLSAYFITFSGLMRKIKQTLEKDSPIKQSKIFNDIKNVDLFILDDIGIGSQTDYEMNVLYDVINIRQGKANIYTTNLGRDEFAKNKNWSRIQSRLFDNQTTKRLAVVSDDYRQLPPF